jgi:hypothetical protein
VPEVILALVQHKIVRASLEEGLAEGRALLQVRLTGPHTRPSSCSRPS